MIEPGEVSQPMETAISLDQTAGGEFLSLDELGKVLSQLASQGLILAFDFLKRSFIMCSCHYEPGECGNGKGNYLFSV